MAIDFSLNQPAQGFAQGFEITNRLMKLAADKQAGAALAKGDRKAASAALSTQGFNEDADAMTQRGLNQQQTQAATAASEASTRSTNQATDAALSKENLDFTLRTATTLKQVLDKDGPAAIPAAFDMMAPLLQSKGVDPEHLAHLRDAVTKDPVQTLEAIIKATNDKLAILPLGAKAVDPTSGKTMAENPMTYNPNVNVAPGGIVKNLTTGETLAENPKPPEEDARILTAEEAKALGFRPGVIVQKNKNGYNTVDEPPTSGTGSGPLGPDGNPLPKLSPQTESQLGDIRTNNNKARQFANAGKEFIQLNRRWKGTGGVMAVPFAKETVGAFDKDVARMNTIAEGIIPKMREAGSGTTSDRDAARFEKATLSVGSKLETNEATFAAMEAYADRMSDYNDFADAYALRYGTLVGAQGMWDRYIADPKNDVLTGGDGNEPLRPVRPDQTWREYLKWDSQPRNSDTGAPQQVKSYVWTPEGGLQPQ